MRISVITIGRLMLPCWFLGAGVWASIAQAEGPTPGPGDMANLEKRVQELEAVIRQLQTERQTNPAAAAPSAVLPEPGTTPSPAPGDGDQAPGTDSAIGSGSTGAANTAGGPGGFGGLMPRFPTPGPGGRSSPSGEVPPYLAGWDNNWGFFLRSPNNNFIMRITGQIQADYRAFLDGRDYTDPDSFLVRRARLGIEADLFQYYEFRLMPDFSNGQSATSTTAQTRLRDAYMNVHWWEPFQIEVGKFKQPFSYEQLIQDRFVPTMERSLIDQLVPRRDLGIMIHGRGLLDKRLDYGASIFNGEIDGDYDTNKLKDYDGRVVVRPFFTDEQEWTLLKRLQLGMSVTSGVEEEPIVPNTLHTPATVKFFQFNSSVRAQGIRWRYSPEVSYFYKPFGMAGQLYYEHQAMSPSLGGPVVVVPFEGGYILATYLLTGEQRTTYSMPIAPLHNFDPYHPCVCTGAWELVGRVSRLEMGPQVFEPIRTGPRSFAQLANPALWSRGATESTIGFNWYLNKLVRMQFNWEHAWFDTPVRLGPGNAGLLKFQDTLMTRFQIIF